MIKRLDIENLIEVKNKRKLEGGPQFSISSNMETSCGSPSSFYFTEEEIEENELNYLAKLLVDIFLEEKSKNKNYANNIK